MVKDVNQYIFALVVFVIYVGNISAQQLSLRRNNQLQTQFNSSDYDPPPISTLHVPLYGSHQTHHVYAYIGSPPQRQLLIVDTGSRLTSFTCEPCQQCGHHVSKFYFNPETSSTDRYSSCDGCHFHQVSKCQDDECRYLQRFTEGSTITGYEINDLFWLGTGNFEESMIHHLNLAVPFTFGCQSSESGLFKTQHADGIMGMSMHQKNVIDVMYESGAIIHNAFSICLTRTSGVMSIGGTSLTLKKGQHLEPMHFSPISRDHGWYSVQIISIYLGDILLTNQESLRGFNDEKGTILDTGTADIYLPSTITKPFKLAWERLTGDIHGNKIGWYTYDEFWSMPDLILTLSGGFHWVIGPENYLEESFPVTNSDFAHHSRWTGKKVFTNRIYLDEPKGCVLGANAMYGYDILFDIQNNMLGIAQADCLKATN